MKRPYKYEAYETRRYLFLYRMLEKPIRGWPKVRPKKAMYDLIQLYKSLCVLTGHTSPNMDGARPVYIP